MFELGEYLQLPELQEKAYRCLRDQNLTDCKFNAADQTNYNMVAEMDHRQDADQHDCELFGSRLNLHLLGPKIEHTMSYEALASLEPIINLMCAFLAEIREEIRPPSCMDQAYSLLSQKLLYTSWTETGEKCDCGNELAAHQSCIHGWSCGEVHCTETRQYTLFCDACGEFVEVREHRRRTQRATMSN